MTETSYSWVTVTIVAVCYLLPSVIALLRRHHSKGAIVAVNILLGWSVVGWLWAFIWSLTGVNRPIIVVQQTNFDLTNTAFLRSALAAHEVLESKTVAIGSGGPSAALATVQPDAAHFGRRA